MTECPDSQDIDPVSSLVDTEFDAVWAYFKIRWIKNVFKITAVH